MSRRKKSATLPAAQAAVAGPKPRRGQLFAASLLLAAWLVFLAAMAWTA